MNTTNTTAPVDTTPPAQAVQGLLAFTFACLMVVSCFAIALFVRHTSCYVYIKYWALRAYARCCRASPHYSQHLEEHAQELRDMLGTTGDTPADVL